MKKPYMVESCITHPQSQSYNNGVSNSIFFFLVKNKQHLFLLFVIHLLQAWKKN